MTRREIFSTAAATPLVALPLMGAASGEMPPQMKANLQDAELLALRSPWLSTLADFNAALNAKGKIDKAISARSAPSPDYKTFPGSFSEYSAACSQVTAERDAIAAELGAAEADQLEIVTADANAEVVDQIAEMPARTLAGLRFKVEVSADWVHQRENLIESIMADILALGGGFGSTVRAGTPTARPTDPIFAQIELHKTLRIRANTIGGTDGDPRYEAAQKAEESAIQKLGEMAPTSIASAAAQLEYVAEVEGCFADDGSPLLRTVQTVARALVTMSAAAAA